MNPQEQTTTLIQNMCALLYDTYLYQTPEGKLQPPLVTKTAGASLKDPLGRLSLAVAPRGDVLPDVHYDEVG